MALSDNYSLPLSDLIELSANGTKLESNMWLSSNNCTNVTYTISPKSGTIHSITSLVNPVITTVGMFGNILNIIVMNGKGMRSKTNLLLSALACADLLFFVCYFPLTLEDYQVITKLAGFITFYVFAKFPLVGFSNWFSAASIWLSVAVTVERVIAVKFPLHARLFWQKKHVVIVIICIYILAFAITSNYYVIGFITRVPLCSDPSTLTYKWDIVHEKRTPGRFAFFKYGQAVFCFFVYAIPLVLLMVLNSILIHDLRKNSQFQRDESEGKRNSNATRMRKNERKVTCMVVAIIGSFIILNTPSIVIVLFEYVNAAQRMPPWYYQLTTSANMLVSLSKALNFILYCISSSSFRANVIKLLCHKDGWLYRGMKKYSTFSSLRRRSHSLESQVTHVQGEIDAHSDAKTCLIGIRNGQKRRYSQPISNNNFKRLSQPSDKIPPTIANLPRMRLEKTRSQSLEVADIFPRDSETLTVL